MATRILEDDPEPIQKSLRKYPSISWMKQSPSFQVLVHFSDGILQETLSWISNEAKETWKQNKNKPAPLLFFLKHLPSFVFIYSPPSLPLLPLPPPPVVAVVVDVTAAIDSTRKQKHKVKKMIIVITNGKQKREGKKRGRQSCPR